MHLTTGKSDWAWRDNLCAPHGASRAERGVFRYSLADIYQHAHALENLLAFLQPGSRVLDVGSGSGYLAAVLHYLVTDTDTGVTGTVVGIDHIPELVEWSVDNLRRDNLGAEVDSELIKMVVGDGRAGKSVSSFVFSKDQYADRALLAGYPPSGQCVASRQLSRSYG